MADIVTIAHFSDLHLGPIPRPKPWQLLNKRIFGFVNWHRRRRSDEGMDRLEALVRDAATMVPDVTVLTGDFVNIALPQEFAQARHWLDARFDPAYTMAVLGNHDAYVPGAINAARTTFADYLRGDNGGPLPVRRIGGAALVGVNSAVARPPHLSSGRVGQQERDALLHTLERLGDTFKIVLIHYPPDQDLARGRRGLDDCEEVREVLAAGNANLVLHGHNHRPSARTLTTRDGEALMVGVESGSSDGSHYPPAAYNIYRINTGDGAVTMEKRTAIAANTISNETFNFAPLNTA